MEFAQSRALIAIGELSSFRKAGERLNLSPPAVFAQIHQLESDLGEKLYQRNGRKLVLTPAGRMLLDYCRRLVSTHDEAELERALAFAPDYIALGPIYPTRLKIMPFGPQGLDKITQWKRRIGAVPLVAIGGLTPERAKLCLAAGADSAAVVTDITLNPDPEARIAQWLAATQA